ncbi:mechanosensitive ion channel family protein [Desulfogranum japonicum]|uniref:mechanosensitive ion channel family protein n=1 Tax=Desulfogranum japonicum TaxID=231447 RepID=UPI00040A66A0|nr:mechanosensitive ion channel domain-containing protein [Desulfogranum japonicum]
MTGIDEVISIGWLAEKLTFLKLNVQHTELAAASIFLAGVVLLALFVTILVRQTLLHFVTRWIQNNQYHWDDPLASNRLLTKVSWFVPVAIISLALDSFFDHGSSVYILSKRFVMAGFVIVGMLSLTALFSSITDIHRILSKQKGSSLRGYTDACKIITFVLGGIFLVSIFTGKSPWGVISILGGLTAITMLVFKDSILGFVASVQLTTSDMVRIGDWIEMPQYGADGDVISISINCIRVQNWDKTITTIPTYALISSSFKNWRGMSESGGRRIKRSLLIDIASIRFCDAEMLQQFRQYRLISSYIEDKELQITEYNTQSQVDPKILLNFRRQTNVGVFRAYVAAYLKANTQLNHKMTFLVRQLQPTEKGLPLQIYVFSADTAWARYEEIQADIFDHLLAALPEFGLRVFQYPSGADIQQMVTRGAKSLSDEPVSCQGN